MDIPRLQFVRFHKYDLLESNGRVTPFRFAVCYTLPDYATRTTLYEDAERITRRTGWYPLITGRRFRRTEGQASPRYLKRVDELTSRERSRVWGPLRQLVPLDAINRGCAFLVSLDNGSILLDAGFELNLDALERKPNLAIITHNHRDHAGGIGAVLKARIPLALTRPVYLQLVAVEQLDHSHDELLYIIEPPCGVALGQDLMLRFVTGAHSPGTVMVEIQTPVGGLLYSSDVCIQNAFDTLDIDETIAPLRDSNGPRWLVADGTFLGHEPKAGEIETLEELEPLVQAAMEAGQSLAFCAEDAEYIYPVWLWFYRRFYYQREWPARRHIVIQDNIEHLLDSTYEEFLFREHRPDRYLERLFGSIRTNYLESVRLYGTWGSRLPRGLPKPIDLFCVGAAYTTLRRQLGTVAATVFVGRAGNSVTEIEADCRTSGQPFFRADGPDFSFHSKAQDVVRLVQTAIGAGIRPIVFHNLPKRVRKALASAGVPKDAFDCIFASPIDLSQE